MSQISPPLRILLIGCFVFMAAWFTVLKPGGEEAIPAAPAVATDPASQAAAAADGTNTGQPASAAGQAVQQAQQGAATAGQAASARAGETAAPATAPATGTKAAPAATPLTPAQKAADKAELVKSGLPADVAAQLDDRVIALAFVNDGAADDRRVRGSMKKVYRHDGKVWAHTASIADVSKYTQITRGADIVQSPSVLIIDKHRNVTPLVGFVDSVTINQAVIDALLIDGAPVSKSKYLQKLEGMCTSVNSRVRDLKDPKNFKQFSAWLASLGSITGSFSGRVEKLNPPSQYRGLHRDVLKYLRADQAGQAKLRSWVKDGRYPASSANAMVSDLEKQSRTLDLRLAGLGMDDCR
jgi:hypothetical protein